MTASSPLLPPGSATYLTPNLEAWSMESASWARAPPSLEQELDSPAHQSSTLGKPHPGQPRPQLSSPPQVLFLGLPLSALSQNEFCLLLPSILASSSVPSSLCPPVCKFLGQRPLW